MSPYRYIEGLSLYLTIDGHLLPLNRRRKRKKEKSRCSKGAYSYIRLKKKETSVINIYALFLLLYIGIIIECIIDQMPRPSFTDLNA